MNEEFARPLLGGVKVPNVFYTHGRLPSGTTNPAPLTVTGVNIGTPSENRRVVILVSVIQSNATGVTVNGVALTKTASLNNSGTGTHNAEFWEADIPTGSTATVVVTAAGGSYISFLVFPMYNLKTGLIDTAFDRSGSVSTTAARSGSLNVPKDGLVIAFAVTGSGNPANPNGALSQIVMTGMPYNTGRIFGAWRGQAMAANAALALSTTGHILGAASYR